MCRAAILAVLLLAGCAGHTPPDEVRATYRCDDGTVLPARFDNRAGALDLTLPEGSTVRLTQQRAASGIWYVGEGHELRGKGREATITLAGRPLTCRSD